MSVYRVAQSVIRKMMSDTDVLVAVRRVVEESDTPVTRAALRGTIKRAVPEHRNVDELERAAIVEYQAFKIRTADQG